MNHINHEAIHYFVESQVVNGYHDGSFRPAQTITRAEATKLTMASFKPIAVIQGIKNDLLAQNQELFADVDPLDWYAPYVFLAAQQGFISGYKDHTFRPHDTIRFAEGLKLIFNTYHLAIPAYAPMPDRLIATSSDWYVPYFSEALKRHIINPDQYYHPSQRMTRGNFWRYCIALKC
ncbi:S-layer homology domain-containing protein [Candidatus Peregrinibacteria bacterium]|nr:MAG: S-layer homology domain-containing protein [Candidatus Peregrinibacteria bacterium]